MNFGERLDKELQRINDVNEHQQRDIESLLERVEKLEQKPPPTPPPELPFKGRIIGEYNGTKITKANSSWPDQYRQLLTSWQDEPGGRAAKNRKVPIPLSDESQLFISVNNYLPDITPEGKIYWDHDGGGNRHSQTGLICKEGMSASHPWYFKKEVKYAVMWTQNYDLYPVDPRPDKEAWVNMFQAYGRFSDGIVAKRDKNILTVFSRDAKLELAVARGDGTVYRTLEEDRINLDTDQDLTFCLVFQIFGRTDSAPNTAELWYKQENTWHIMDSYSGQIGTGELMVEPDAIAAGHLGPYTGQEIEATLDNFSYWIVD